MYSQYIPEVDTYTESRHWTTRTMLHTHNVSTGPTSKWLCVREASIVNTLIHSTVNMDFIPLRNHEWAIHKQKF